MAALMLTEETYLDRVLGGWTGKSIGVTLGASLRGQKVPGRLNYYNPTPGQPVPSIAVDFPLVWLSALEEFGPDITSEDLAVAWLEHLDYSMDELGFAALNLRRGLPPPASGAYSNWFRHATGGIARADFWAMVAPGAPQVAASYAYHDATLDHCEDGEWAAMFLAAMGSAAFFITEPLPLITIGLAMIPRTCRTARAVKTALAAAHRAASWLEAREAVQNEVGHSNFTDAPQNMGFLTIGLLYGGGDFGASLCAAVNCGYDAELTGGALGALLGILRGRSRLPEEWTRPIGDVVIPGYGLKDMDLPETLTAVANRTVVAGKRVIARRCADVVVSGPEGLRDAEPVQDMHLERDVPSPLPPLLPEEDETASKELFGSVSDTNEALPSSGPADGDGPGMGEVVPPVQPVSEQAAAPIHTGATLNPGVTPRSVPDYTTAIAWADNTLVKPLLVTPPTAMVVQAGPFRVVMDTGDAPSIGFGHPKSLVFTVFNRGEKPFNGRIALLAPAGWQVDAPPQFGQRQHIAASTGILRAEYRLLVSEGQGRIEIANAVMLRLMPDGGEVSYDAEFVLMGAFCWWCVGPFANFDGEGFDRSYLPEDRPGLHETYTNRMHQTVRWEKWVFPESTLDLEPLFKGSAGVCYGQTVLHCPAAREARLVASTNNGVKVWLNGALVLRRYQREAFRPQVGSGDWAVDVHLQAGPNVVMVKWVRGNEPYQFNLSVSDRSGRGLPEIGNTSW